ncbi:helix-turn-helix domain-containing protein [Nonomuraea sp. NPDC049129]|uniref:helix-turn-helix domain-containing protein n=1 Tax=unclassified Nonomuraea TaxID=2593643 RepID=UPI0033C81774
MPARVDSSSGFAELERRGFFLVKQAPETAAAALGVSRFTIYQNVGQCSGVYTGGEGPRGSAR